MHLKKVCLSLYILLLGNWKANQVRLHSLIILQTFQEVHILHCSLVLSPKSGNAERCA
ncbi:hypothetical protein GLYMA_03G034809v4 [Glycine max]|nr:hypothetical protein GLYMA_03G034809v4 [Glycine max]